MSFTEQAEEGRSHVFSHVAGSHNYLATNAFPDGKDQYNNKSNLTKTACKAGLTFSVIIEEKEVMKQNNVDSVASWLISCMVVVLA
eukprot:scaffold110_cov89-Skeletonema_dohrnii-CCMP3373.AAC.8